MKKSVIIFYEKVMSYCTKLKQKSQFYKLEFCNVSCGLSLVNLFEKDFKTSYYPCNFNVHNLFFFFLHIDVNMNLVA